MVAIVDEEECIGCGNCLESCPVDAITLNDVAKVSDDCIECGTCVSNCPTDAISLS